MKPIIVALALSCLIACTQQDENRAKAKVKEAGRELKQDAHRASEQAGPKLHQAGEELNHDAARASQKLKEGSQKLDKDLHKQLP